MGLKVHGDISSPFVKIVIMTLDEKNEDFELVFGGLSSLKTEEFTAKNPFGLMPAFEDGDLVLFESRAIARYVEAKFEGQGTALLGTNIREHALVNVWNDVESQTFYPSIWPICREFYSKKVPDVSVIEASREKLEKVLDIYETQLSKRKYLAGDFFSFADLFHIPVLHFLQCLSDDTFRSVINSRPHVYKWHQDITSRPSWKKIISEPKASDWSYIPKV
ncbi:hypothetical protein R1sor_011535 [Riccia sorocarpa]|uniref:glutathione transferase n=1 Tax=Riccia sorocarpa TaxID=122646 RepID=A0ABD3I780_9MARC